MTAQAEFAELQFADGEKGLHLFDATPESPNTSQYFEAEFGERAIRFYALNENGERPALPKDLSRIEQRPDCELLGDTNYSLYVRPDGDDRQWWYGYSISTVTHLGEVARSLLQPRGAHSFPLLLLDGDGPDGLFTDQIMNDAFSDGVFLFASNARQYLHDVKVHGRSVISLENDSAETLQSICQLTDLRKKRYPELRQFISSIITAYDITIADYTDPKKGLLYRQLEPTRRDPLLTTIMQQAIRDRYPGSFMAELVSTIEAGPFTFNVGKQHVRRLPSVLNYYISIAELAA